MAFLWQYLPKGIDIRATHKPARRIVRQLNERPRKTLGYQTPAEMFNHTVALTVESAVESGPLASKVDSGRRGRNRTNGTLSWTTARGGLHETARYPRCYHLLNVGSWNGAYTRGLHIADDGAFAATLSERSDMAFVSVLDRLGMRRAGERCSTLVRTVASSPVRSPKRQIRQPGRQRSGPCRFEAMLQCGPHDPCPQRRSR